MLSGGRAEGTGSIGSRVRIRYPRGGVRYRSRPSRAVPDAGRTGAGSGLHVPLLAIETATSWAVVALAAPDGSRLVAIAEPGPRHGRVLVPTIAELLERAGMEPGALDAVAVGLGPGSFTGLRIGVVAAKAIAIAVGCPLIGLSSLEVIARNAPDQASRVAVALDAQRGEVFAADFSRDVPGGPLRRLGPDRIEPARSWLGRLPGDAVALCPTPESFARITDDPPPIAVADQGRPDGRALLTVALEAFAAGTFADPWFLEPTYLRRSAAEEKRDAAP